MKKRFTEEQIIGFLREAEAGLPVPELCRRHGFSEASYSLWRSKFGGMNVSDAKRLKELETENARLKRLLAESMLENALRAKPLEVKEQYERQIKDLQEAYGEAMLELRARKKLNSMLGTEGDK